MGARSATRLRPQATLCTALERAIRLDCCYKAGVEVPSDYCGVVLIPMDEGGNWKQEVARKLQAAGVPIDIRVSEKQLVIATKAVEEFCNYIEQP